MLRSLFSKVLLVLVVVGFSFLSYGKPKPKAAKRPNILLILSDDHSADFLSASGYKSINTPNIDRLAKEGIRFTRAYTTAPQCVLSRAAIMTGRSTLDIHMSRFSAPLSKDVVTYPELLRKSGYFTGVAGRNFHLNGDKKTAESKSVFEKNKLETFKDRVDYLRVSGNIDTIYQQYNEFLDSAPKNKPFFLQLGYSDPHRIFNATEFEPDPQKIELPTSWPDTKFLREDFAAYLGEIQRLDREVGRVLDDLKKRGLEENTLVVFMGDNGGALLRGKGTLYNLGINVPLIFRHPALIKKEQVTDALVSGEDIAPTFLNAAGVPIPKEVTGHSLVPFFEGGKNSREYAFSIRGAHGSGLPTNSANFDLGRTIIGKKYKFIYNAMWQLPYHPVDFASQPFWLELKQLHTEGKLDKKIDQLLFSDRRSMFELYDLEEDPQELNNLSGNEKYFEFELYDLEEDPQELNNLSGNEKYFEVENELKARLHEWMILNEDYIPLPVVVQPPPARVN